ncbi:LacI family DNA-binding transcriptional regulator [Anaerosporobacter faecicola]|uniref:LacI family DNA-binding transcriptional regulator n=1 Tax=Anaerosporobacter faecicola TaxID=2718714 RepID=UPI001439FF45|nr:LacI family DNA-binding transcriptional regulator [Anaerosporobacter faecicola]
MDEERVRIRDIAEELGLSTATVSNVLHGKTKKVSEETIKRVEKLLEDRQYIPSMAGILLAQNDSKIIGVVVNDHIKYEGRTLEDVFIATSLNHLSTEIEKSGQFMMLKKTTVPEDIIKFASMWNMAGLVLIGFCDQDYMYLRNRMHIPFVVYDGYCDHAERIYNITIDNYDGGRQVGNYLKQKGHQNVLCISDNQICVDKERYDGFREGFGTGADFMLIPMEKEKRKTFYIEQIEKIRSYTAIFAVSDYYAIELIHFLQEQGIEVPNEISVVGFDDTPMCELVSPTVTSVRQDVSQRAKIAIKKLQELKESKQTETVIRLSVSLIERESSC